MNKQLQKSTAAALCLALAFAAWTALVCLVDVQAIGPRGSTVGLATLNGAFHRLSGVHMTLYHVTDWLGLVPIGTALAFAVLGLVQWIGRKRLLSVDRSLFALGVFYLLVIGAYALFEYVVINRRPVLIEGYLEVSYPSSTTLLVACVMPTAWMQLRDRVGHTHLRCLVSVLLWGFTLFMVVGRLVSGVHWLSDVVGGLLLSGALAAFYVRTAYGADQEKEEKRPCRGG